MSDSSPEQVLRNIWSDILGCSDLLPDADFFQLGGDSLQMMIMLFRVNETLRLELTPEAVFENPTFGLFANYLSRALTNRQEAQEGTI